ncbi:DUF4251 domain-containing protein [Aquimarina sp. D1M17]|uniref:DUF4251 domain-containing protein n=1 Tax=Aquimarina acroporae TaxID=2937283 RepID=UPI0020BE6033|nr:DUF4251 domain-containing protein [Aquimarina acroporae]MCK8520065.1 DUF4251 domain-containing protein [Aquimarina acroporae]
MRIVVFTILVSSVLLGCSSTNRVAKQVAPNSMLDQWVEQQAFEISLDWAYPSASIALNNFANTRLAPLGSTLNNISLIGNPNYIKMKGDSLSVYLPYFGERQLAAEYNSNRGGIEFNGVPTRVKLTKNEKKQSYMYTFFLNEGREANRMVITLFPNLVANVSVTSSHRTPITYRGEVSAFTQEQLSALE